MPKTLPDRKKRIVPTREDFALGGAAGAYSIETFCAAHAISRSSFYLLLKDGKAPRLMRIGTRVLISREAAADWRRERESEAA
jgi:predicted DNA-binding transcriptional regulator AlpA